MVAQPRGSKNTNSPINAKGAKEMTAMTDVQTTIVSANSNSTTTIAQGANAMNTAMTVAQFAVENTTKYIKTVAKPSVSLTEEQIAGMSVRSIFEAYIMSGRIKFSRAANETRKQGIPVIFHNKLQDDQLGRALAYTFAEIHKVFGHNIRRGAGGAVVGGDFALLDMKGEQDRTVRAEVRADGKVYYSARYGVRMYNNMGQLIGVNPGEYHPINDLLLKRAENYNAWVDAHNNAVRAKAAGTATDEQLQLLSKVREWDVDANIAVRNNVVRHINGEALVNKYVLEMLLLLDTTRPAFEIYTYAKNVQEMEKYLDLLVNSMERAFRNELRKLAGLITYEENEKAE